MFHVFNASLSGRIDSIKNIGYLWNPKLNIYFVAAKETMKSGILPRILAYAGSVSIERTWREKGVEIKRQVKMSDISNIGTALEDGGHYLSPRNHYSLQTTQERNRSHHQAIQAHCSSHCNWWIQKVFWQERHQNQEKRHSSVHGN